jgi:hypothetical protein
MLLPTCAIAAAAARLVLVVLLIAVSSGNLEAQYAPKPTHKQRAANQDPNESNSRESIATLVYDAKLREFRCWSEGALKVDFRATLCKSDDGWHPLNANLYFVRSQSITLVVTDAVAEDIFSRHQGG